MLYSARITAIVIACASLAAACADAPEDSEPGAPALEEFADVKATVDNSIDQLVKHTGELVVKQGETLLDNVSASVFGGGGEVRSTKVVITNHSDRSLFFSGSSFDSGGFSVNGNSSIGEIRPKSINGYMVGSKVGIAVGVTEASIRFSDMPGTTKKCVEIKTSNPYAGSNHSTTSGGCGFKVNPPVTSKGDHNQVFVDIF